MKRHTKRTIERGDFQTPRALALRVCELIARAGVVPGSVLEPTCGQGTFLEAAVTHFQGVRKAVGVELDPNHAARARRAMAEAAHSCQIDIVQEDFFQMDWPRLLETLPDPLLIIGNPPWVSNSTLSTLGSDNRPARSNFRGERGIDALTGRSNFDISEWMLCRGLEWLEGRDATLAMLCKTAVARNLLHWAWSTGLPIGPCALYRIDAQACFQAAVAASLLVVRSAGLVGSVANGVPQGDGCRARMALEKCCAVYSSLGGSNLERIFGLRDGQLVSDIDTFEGTRPLEGSSQYTWRSGMKHDCARVMELERIGASGEEGVGRFTNRLGETFELEETCCFPLLKSSDLAASRTLPDNIEPRRWVLVTQRNTGEDTAPLGEKAPRVWRYLERHGDLLDRRASSIYRGRPRFSIFGIGPYAFAPWKVGISGLYKKLRFRVISPYLGRPVMLDDTGYFVPCQSEEEAVFLARLLASSLARRFFSARVFWDAKRPITSRLLRRLDLLELARESGQEEALMRFIGRANGRWRTSSGSTLKRTSPDDGDPSSLH